ncbi:carboxymuconolactone decarboxylase family protein [Nitrospirillum viridazoti]|uniref:4-carboxymuconolactone decarboxylase n=1 Tax=Nitrospirillum viridazoti CBAmc TaxID=1441467 RepID=A0A248K2R9_9PROT|nr:carboxymuconolactone decarboxylase family protein [Nitrospirillum amazonense]ASG25021.1 4-carboxymuconolactone decarboxylase [Nitrospirillum amazonense CBAmc]TWB31225.1 4-carboxymuconolactone decarboxylase [Nitrospirillum amazonense]
MSSSWDTDAAQRGRDLREQIFGAEGMKSLVEADDFTLPLQDMVTRTCFGEVWSRPGLPLKIRSMLTIAILVGQSRPAQLRNHVKGAIANGVTKEEIREILLHATLYAGLPAGADSWREAAAALREINAY